MIFPVRFTEPSIVSWRNLDWVVSIGSIRIELEGSVCAIGSLIFDGSLED